jgi:DNA repair protein RadC
MPKRVPEPSEANLTVEFKGPRERLRLYGPCALSDADLVALLLGTGTADEPVSLAAARLLHRLGGLHGLGRAAASELEEQLGIGATKAARLLAAIELGARVSARPLQLDAPITSSRDVYSALRARVRGQMREHFFAVALDAKNRPLSEIQVATGGLLACGVTPSDVFRPVLRAGAAGVIFAHNHPSGDPTPSEQDIDITERLCQAGDLLGVQVLDHLVLGDGSYFSFLDRGLLRSGLPVRPSHTGA